MYTPKLSDVVFHEENWKEFSSDEDSTTWHTERMDVVVLRVVHSSLGFPFDFTDHDKARSVFNADIENTDKALVGLNIEKVKGVETFTAIYKFNSTDPDSLAKCYEAVISIFFMDFCFVILFNSEEYGETGQREAIVTAKEVLDGEIQVPKTPHPGEKTLETKEELLKMLKGEGKPAVLSSDDEKYDHAFPDHPLTIVRNLVRNFKSNVVFSEELIKQKPHRVE